MFNLKIISINCCSLVSHRKRIQLQKYLAQYKPDIALLQETRLNSRHRVHINGYDLIYIPINDTPNDVGTAIVVRTSISRAHVHSTLKIGFGTFLNVTVADRKILIGSFYLHPHHTNAAAKKALNELTRICSTYDTAIIGGDFNAHYRLPRNANGNALENFISANTDFTLLTPPSATHCKGNTLDYFLIKDNQDILPDHNCDVLDRFSDHYGILLHISNRLPIYLQMNEPQFRLSYEGTNWGAFNELIELKLRSSEDWNLFTISSIDNAIAEITEAINLGIDHFLVKPVLQQRGYRDLPDNVIFLLKMKKRTLRALSRESERSVVREDLMDLLNFRMNLINSELDQDLRNHFSAKFHNKLKGIVPGQHVFRDINRITGRKSMTEIKYMEDNCGNPAVNPEEIANIFRDYYSEIFREQTPPPHVLPDTPITPDGHLFTNYYSVATVIKSLNNKKSAGPDKISNFLIKKLSQPIIMILTRIFQACLLLKYFPTAWKTAKIIPFFKKGDKRDPGNYRPISLVNCFGKILEKIILKFLLPEIETSNILPPYQTGFRADHSCVDAAAVLRDMGMLARSRKMIMAVCLLDIKKAFDSVWIAGLCWKLAYFGISSGLCAIITSFLSNRSAIISIGSHASLPFSICRGVPQGTVLGPHLYNLFVSDQPIPIPGGDLLQFADDTANIACAKTVHEALQILQAQNDRLESYYNKWGIAVNGAKSELIICRKSRDTQLRDCKIKVAGEDVIERSSALYLGITFQDNLSPTLAALTRLNKAHAAAASLNQMMGSRYLSQKVKKMIYTSLIRPVATYGSPIWVHCTKKAMKKLEIFERKQLRKVTGLYYNKHKKKTPSNIKLYKAAKITPIKEHINKLNNRFQRHYKHHSNPFVKGWARQPSKYLKGRRRFTRHLRAKE